jgi:membrane fusion protein (multidrug efflux system)
MRPSYNAPEAPTHLRAGDLPPGLLDDLDPITSASRAGSYHSASAARTRRREHGDAAQARGVDDHSLVSSSRSRSASAAAPRVHTEPASVPTPPGRSPRSTPRSGLPQVATPVAPQTATPRARPTRSAQAGSGAQPLPPPPAAPVAAPPAQTRSRSASAPQPAPRAAHPAQTSAPQTATPRSRSASAPQPAPPAADAAPQLAGVGTIDPLAIATPPELAGPIYSHIRRLALQANLAGADRVIRDALAELTSSLSCTIVYPGRDGLWTLGADEEIPRDPQPLIAVANARRAIIASHMALIPVVTTAETVAVITLTRNPRQPAYQVIEQVAMVALAREAAPILHHLAIHHLQHASEIQADKGSLYRGEALEAHRTRGQEGTLVQLSPTWVKRAYPLLVITIIAAACFAVFVKVPTYSTGTAVIVFEGSTSVTATAGGTVDKVFVAANQAVKQGDPLLRLNSPDELATLTQADTEWRDTQIQFLFDERDEQVRKSLMSAATSRAHALARIEARTIRAPRDGVVTNLHVKEGGPVQLGSYVMQITDEDSEIEVLAFLPGADGPRIRETMPLQLQLDSYTKARAIAKITRVQPDAVSGAEAAKLAGDMLAESFAKELQAGTWIAVRARLPTRTFKAEHSTYNYHHGMHAKVEVKIRSKPFLVTLLPALEKYLPE